MLRKLTALIFLALGCLSTILAFAERETASPAFKHHRIAGAVYAMTNAAKGNEIIIYNRSADGRLNLSHAVATGGLGPTERDEPFDPLDALGSQGSLILSRNNRLLFAVNAGSNEISVFRVRHNRLKLVDKVSSGGDFPSSLTIHRNLLYVLNSGGKGNITGFTVGHKGSLTPLAGSTRSLNTGGVNPPFFLVSPAQIQFDPSGDMLVVTIKEPGDNVPGNGPGEIRVFPLDDNGLPGKKPVTTIAAGTIPFGFTFDRRGHLLVVEAFGQAEVIPTGNAGAVSSYDIDADGSLEVISTSVENFQTATCWIAPGRRFGSRFAYATNNASATISGYRIGRNGSLSLLDANGVTAMTNVGPVDLAITPNGRFLYNVNAGTGTVGMYRINKKTGRLTSLGEVDGLPVDDGAVGIAVR